MRYIKHIFLLMCIMASVNARGITNEELSAYFDEFIREYPALKFSGFFTFSDTKSDYNKSEYPKARNMQSQSTNHNNKRGLHISNCVDNECQISYNDYTNYKDDFTPLPECFSPQKLRVIDSTHAEVIDSTQDSIESNSQSALIKIVDSKLYIYGEITFTCDTDIIEQNLAKVGAVYDPLDSHTYEITLKDVALNAHFNYPINLNCITRPDFSESNVCAKPLLSDSYSFNQFFIFLAARAPQSFRHPDSVYISYKKMQSEISMCVHARRYGECIYAALGKFDSKIRDNLLINETPHAIAEYRLLR